MAVEAPVLKGHNVFRDGSQRIDIRCTTVELDPLDMTGFALRWRLKTAKNGSVLVEKTVGAGIVVVDGAGVKDEAQVTVALNDWHTQAEGEYYHALERTDPGSECVLSFGTFYLNEV